MKNLISKDWWLAAFYRALKTFCEALLILIGTDQVGFLDVDWLHIFSVAGMMAVVSILASIKGLPEVDKIIDFDDQEYFEVANSLSHDEMETEGVENDE